MSEEQAEALVDAFGEAYAAIIHAGYTPHPDARNLVREYDKTREALVNLLMQVTG